MEECQVSIVIPIHNEAEILEDVVPTLIDELGTLGNLNYEIVLCENGSWDGTLDIVGQLKESYPQVRVEILNRPSYGKALRKGLLSANGKYIVVFNTDLIDVRFVKVSMAVFDGYDFDIIVGSKVMHGAKDHRPLMRRIITRNFNRLLRVVFGFRGTDTHGIKILDRKKIMPVLGKCKTDDEIFDTELLIRAQKEGLRIFELPAIVEEKRLSTYSLLKRVPKTLKDLAILFYYIRLRGGA